MVNYPTELIRYVDIDTRDIFQMLKSRKGGKIMVDIEKIKQDIANLEVLSAEDYCRPEVEKIYADFEENRARKIGELTTALEIFDKYQIVEDEEESTEETENAGE